MNGEYRQLNDNVLQLENELYAPIRPKRTPQRREAPDALEQRGIEYIELRTVDVNPFTPFGTRWIRSASSISSWSGACCARPRALG